MSQSLKVHSVWLSVSLLSFIIGFKFFPSSSENDNSAFKKNVQLTTIGKDDVSKSSGGLTNKKSNTENEIGVGTPKTINQLSGLDIEALGDQLRGSTNPIDRRLAFSKLLEGLTAENALCLLYTSPSPRD